jgi:hypothetical protein
MTLGYSELLALVGGLLEPPAHLAGTRHLRSGVQYLDWLSIHASSSSTSNASPAAGTLLLLWPSFPAIHSVVASRSAC